MDCTEEARATSGEGCMFYAEAMQNHTRKSWHGGRKGGGGGGRGGGGVPVALVCSVMTVLTG
jgi:hypothetical protein